MSSVRGGFTTTPEHMPASHRAHLQWTPAKLIAWGLSLGVSTAAVVTWQLEHRPHPEQGYRACLGRSAPMTVVVKPRLFINPLDEQIRPFGVPFLSAWTGDK